MSEYWVSPKKYFCKYCNIYIADDKPSRTQHETGLKHKGNVERFVRGLYKAGEKRKQDLEEEKREMVRVERAAAAAYAQDVGAGLVKPGSSSTAAPSTSAQAGPSKPKRPADPWANYTTAESLGIVDPDAERMKMEAERRRNEGVVGDWEVITVEEPAPGAGDAGAAEVGVPSSGEAAKVASTQQEAGRKREAEAPPDDDDARAFKLRRKKLAPGLGELYDPGLIPIKLKPKKEEPADTVLKTESSPSGLSSSAAATGAQGSALPKWSSRGWNKPGEAKESAGSSATESEQTSGLVPAPPAVDAKETTPEAAPVKDVVAEVKSESPDVKHEEPNGSAATPPPGGSLFRKRKVPAGGAAGRGRRP